MNNVQYNMPVVWLKPTNARDGKTIARINATLIAADGIWGTVVVDDEKYAVPLSQLLGEVN